MESTLRPTPVVHFVDAELGVEALEASRVVKESALNDPQQ